MTRVSFSTMHVARLDELDQLRERQIPKLAAAPVEMQKPAGRAFRRQASARSARAAARSRSRRASFSGARLNNEANPFSTRRQAKRSNSDARCEPHHPVSSTTLPAST